MNRGLLPGAALALALAVLAAGPASGAPPPTPAPARGAKPAAAAPRRLQDVHIEGEIPVPQVLFITARDQRRFIDLTHRRYLVTSLEAGRQTVQPSWIVLVGDRPADPGKENPR